MNDTRITIAVLTARDFKLQRLSSAAKAYLALFAMFFLTSAGLLAQIPVAPPAPAVMLRSSADLDTMVGAIALYPDPLIAQILPAATLPTQIVMADRFVSGGNDLNLVDQQPWDPSVKAVARYPDVLKMLDTNLDWATALGQAFLYQPQDVMNSIQRLRAQALSLGNLQTTAQQQVVSENGIIEVLPANPTIVYVPVYQPEVVFYQRRPSNGFYVSFGRGFSIGAWLNHDLDWVHHNVIVWGAGHARPANWWHEPPQQRFRDMGALHDFRVWQPRAREIHGDRGWNAPAIHRDVPIVHRESVPPPRVIEHREVERPPAREQVRPQPRVVESHPRPASGALIGVDSARNTQQFSNRGQQSRAVNQPAPRAPIVSRPAPAPRPPTETHSAEPRGGGPAQREQGKK